MQYCPKGPCGGPDNYQDWFHFASPDLLHWHDLGVALTAGDDQARCPDTLGVYSGSTTMVPSGNQTRPVVLYPGVHLRNGGKYMSQCMAVPANASDPLLRAWTKTTVIRDVPPGIITRLHDDSEAFQPHADGRYWMFVAGGASSSPTYGVNLLYSTADFASFRYEHALWNITDGECPFVSCPELYRLPDMTSPDMRVYEALCSVDKYWIGTLDPSAVTFQPHGDGRAHGLYDYGLGRASKSFWEPASGRRIMWSWITEHHPAPYPGWDGVQSVPRHVVYDPATELLRIRPVAEMSQLRAELLWNQSIPQHLSNGTWPLANVRGVQLDLVLRFTLDAAQANASAFSLGVAYAVSPSTGYAARARLVHTPEMRRVSSYPPVMNNTNLPEGDLPALDFRLPANTSDADGIAACQGFCRNHSSQCAGWTYVRGPPVNNGPRCAIKGPLFCAPDSTKAVGSCNGCQPGGRVFCGCISGIMPGHAPCPPASCPSCGGPAPTPAATQLVVEDGQGGEHRVPLPALPAVFDLRILIDHSVIEVYALDGMVALSDRIYPAPLDAEGVALLAISDSGADIPGLSVTGQAFRMNGLVIVHKQEQDVGR